MLTDRHVVRPPLSRPQRFHPPEAGEATECGSDRPHRFPPSTEPLPALLSVAEVGTLFRRSERALRDWVRRGHLTSVRVGRSLFFREDDVRALVAGRLRDAVRRA